METINVLVEITTFCALFVTLNAQSVVLLHECAEYDVDITLQCVVEGATAAPTRFTLNGALVSTDCTVVDYTDQVFFSSGCPFDSDRWFNLTITNYNNLTGTWTCAHGSADNDEIILSPDYCTSADVTTTLSGVTIEATTETPDSEPDVYNTTLGEILNGVFLALTETVEVSASIYSTVPAVTAINDYTNLDLKVKKIQIPLIICEISTCAVIILCIVGLVEFPDSDWLNPLCITCLVLTALTWTVLHSLIFYLKCRKKDSEEEANQMQTSQSKKYEPDRKPGEHSNNSSGKP